MDRMAKCCQIRPCLYCGAWRSRNRANYWGGLKYKLITNKTMEAREIGRVEAHRWAALNGYLFKDLEVNARKSYYPTQAAGALETLELNDNE